MEYEIIIKTLLPSNVILNEVISNECFTVEVIIDGMVKQIFMANGKGDLRRIAYFTLLIGVLSRGYNTF